MLMSKVCPILFRNVIPMTHRRNPYCPFPRPSHGGFQQPEIVLRSGKSNHRYMLLCYLWHLMPWHNCLISIPFVGWIASYPTLSDFCSVRLKNLNNKMVNHGNSSFTKSRPIHQASYPSIFFYCLPCFDCFPWFDCLPLFDCLPVSLQVAKLSCHTTHVREGH